jgi:hypothetical protein
MTVGRFELFMEMNSNRLPIFVVERIRNEWNQIQQTIRAWSSILSNKIAYD